MTPRSNVRAMELDERSRTSLGSLALEYAKRRPGWDDVAEDTETSASVLEAELIRPGRPGLVDVVASVGARMVHVVLGVRSAGDEAHFMADTHQEPLGLYEDETGLGVVVDALTDVELATLLLESVAGVEVESGRVRRVRSDAASITLAFEEKTALTVFDEIGVGRHPGLALFLALDEAGFNHLAAPISLWRREGRDLGIAQEYLAGGTSGWALATTSVRDFYATGGSPESAGGDFGGEALRLGIMTARMHLALDRAFGRRRADVGRWIDTIEREIGRVAPALLERSDITRLLAEVRELSGPWRAIRTHGDYQLSRVCRTEQGWYVMDFSPGGYPSTVAGIADEPEAMAPSDRRSRSRAPRRPRDARAQDSARQEQPLSEAPPSPAYGEMERRRVFRSPIADVADMLWSFGRVSVAAAQDRDPAGGESLAELALSWERRNRRAYLAGYLSVPGVNGLLPQGREAVAKLATAFELARAEQVVK